MPVTQGHAVSTAQRIERRAMEDVCHVACGVGDQQKRDRPARLGVYERLDLVLVAHIVRKRRRVFACFGVEKDGATVGQRSHKVERTSTDDPHLVWWASHRGMDSLNERKAKASVLSVG
jgi:hypothetical protein